MNSNKKLFLQYICLAIKIIFFSWILFPIFFIFTLISNIKSRHFLREAHILNYLNNHKHKINGLGDSTIRNLEIEKIHKGVSNLVWKQTFSFNGGKKITLVGKKFLPFGSIITFISSYLGPWPKSIPMSTANRFKQEINALTYLSSDGVDIPEMVFKDEKEKLILMKYIPGVDSGDFLEQLASSGKIDKDLIDLFQDCGKGLARLHGRGLSLVSHNDRSRIHKDDNKVYFVDFELSTQNDNRAWDVAIFMHWVRIKLHALDRGIIEEVERAFIDGYRELQPLNNRAVDRHLDDLRVYIPFAKIGIWINRKWKQQLIRNSWRIFS